MASKKKEIRKAVSNVGNKFDKGDFKSLQGAGLGNNQILKVAASSNKVGAKASSKLSGLNPGINLRPEGVRAPMMGGGAGSVSGAMNQYAEARTQVGKQLAGKKNYYQWQGTTAKGKPMALGGFKVPKSMRSGSQDIGNLLSIGAKAYKRGTFTGMKGGGTYLGRDGSTPLRANGVMKNQPASWMPKNGSGGKGGGGRGGEGGRSSGGEMGNFEMPSYGGDSSSYSTSSDLSGIFGGQGTDLSYGSPSFRRRRSRAQRSGSYTQGPSQLGINLSRTSGLNIMRA